MTDTLGQSVPENAERQYFSIKEGAVIAEASTAFLYKRIGKPDGPPYKRRGYKILLPKDEFLVWVQQRIIA